MCGQSPYPSILNHARRFQNVHGCKGHTKIINNLQFLLLPQKNNIGKKLPLRNTYMSLSLLKTRNLA